MLAAVDILICVSVNLCCGQAMDAAGISVVKKLSWIPNQNDVNATGLPIKECSCRYGTVTLFRLINYLFLRIPILLIQVF